MCLSGSLSICNRGKRGGGGGGGKRIRHEGLVDKCI